MEILHFKDLGDTASVVTNAVVLVLGECQISIPTNLWEICHYEVIADGHTQTDRQTDSLNTIVSQPLRGSTNYILQDKHNILLFVNNIMIRMDNHVWKTIFYFFCMTPNMSIAVHMYLYIP